MARRKMPELVGLIHVDEEQTELNHKSEGALETSEVADPKEEARAPLRRRKGFGLETYFERDQLRATYEPEAFNLRRLKTAEMLRALCGVLDETRIATSNWDTQGSSKQLRTSDELIEQQHRVQKARARRQRAQEHLRHGLPISLWSGLEALLRDERLPKDCPLDRFRVALDCAEVLVMRRPSSDGRGRGTSARPENSRSDSFTSVARKKEPSVIHLG